MNKSDLKNLIKECVKEILAESKTLKESNSNDQILDIEFEGKFYRVEGTYNADVSFSQGGFHHDAHGGGFHPETETDIENEGFSVEEVFVEINGQYQPVTDEALIARLQDHINKTIDFSYDQEQAIQRARNQ